MSNPVPDTSAIPLTDFSTTLVLYFSADYLPVKSSQIPSGKQDVNSSDRKKLNAQTKALRYNERIV